MVEKVIQRKLDKNTVCTEEEISKINAEIAKIPEFREVDENGFCFIPSKGNSLPGTECGCVHCKKHRQP